MVLVGASVLGWSAWQFFGTNAATIAATAAEKSALRQQWSLAPAASASASGSASAVAPSARAKPTKAAVNAIALIRIPRFGSDWEWPIVPGVDDEALAQGVGWFTQTARPGQIGNFALSGHRITHGAPFANLLKIKAGDKIIIETKQAIFTYVMDTSPASTTVLDQTGGWVLDPVPGKPEETPTEAKITLVTCSELFHTDNRSVGWGHLVSAVLK